MGYGVSESLTATLNNLSAPGARSRPPCTRAGTPSPSTTSRSTSPTTGALLARARANAVKDAHAKAAQFAKALGEPLGQVISISSADQAMPIMYGAQASAAKGRSDLAGSQQVSVSITVVYAA